MLPYWALKAVKRCLGYKISDEDRAANIFNFNAKIFVFFDLDHSLLFNPGCEQHYAVCDEYPHLTRVRHKRWNKDIYIIYLAETAALFKELLALNNVEIGFITTAEYTKQEVIPFLTEVYGLPKKSLNKSIYINNSKYGAMLSKGEKLKKSPRIKDKDLVLLADDDTVNLKSAKKHGFVAIRTGGFLLELNRDDDGSEWVSICPPCNEYLSKISEVVRHKIAEIEEQRRTAKLGFVVTHAITVSNVSPYF